MKDDVNILDWVILKPRVAQELSIRPIIQITSGLYNLLEESDYEKWKPKKGEWCWFWNDQNDNKNYILAQFEEMYKYNNQMYSNKKDNVNKGSFSWSNCEPYIDDLPSFLK